LANHSVNLMWSCHAHYNGISVEIWVSAKNVFDFDNVPVRVTRSYSQKLGRLYKWVGNICIRIFYQSVTPPMEKPMFFNQSTNPHKEDSVNVDRSSSPNIEEQKNQMCNLYLHLWLEKKKLWALILLVRRVKP